MFAKLFKPAPAPLTKITTPTAELLPKLNASPEAKALFQPGQSPGEYLQVLESNNKPVESVNLLANGMPEKDSVKWACESSKMVGDKLNPADQKALAAAQNWVGNPTPANQTAAAQAAAATNGKGPGGWAAQAAAWAQPATSAAQTVAPVAAGGGAGPSLAAAAAAGAVMLAAGLVNQPAMPDTPRPAVEIPKVPAPKLKLPQMLEPPKVEAPVAPKMTPADESKLAKSLKPFLDLGKKIASGVA